MATTAENLRFILGLKLRSRRQEAGLSLKQLAGRSGLSISYLSEIETGRKYPKPDKLLLLADALDLAFDDLVSLRVSEDLLPLKEAFSSSLLQEFPFELFGIEPEGLFALLADDPGKVGALIRAFVEVGRAYDVQVEQFLLAGLRSYQQLHSNYFDDLEREAAAFRHALGWRESGPLTPSLLAKTLRQRWGYEVEQKTLAEHACLGDLRSVFVDGPRPRLLLNARLLPRQKAFVLAREIGYRQLGLAARAVTSSWLEADSFEQLLNNFRASYFAGALLIEADSLSRDLERVFAAPRWRARALRGLLRRHGATPEMLFYRLTELVPQRFGLREIFFLRLTRQPGSDSVRLTKVFNMSRVPVPHGISLGEHYCRRWPAFDLLADLAGGADGEDPERPLVGVQRSTFLDQQAEFFVFSMARPLVLSPGYHSCVSLGFLLDDDFRARVRFWDDAEIPRVAVNLTCERCHLAAAECAERVAAPVLSRRRGEQQRKRLALAELLGSFD
jgi:transcriptional regulator with XRE-family HTH domain